MKRSHRSDCQSGLPKQAVIPATELSQLPPWDQLRILGESGCRRRPLSFAYPRVQLTGDKAYLRALRAAELTAWENTAPHHPDKVTS